MDQQPRRLSQFVSYVPDHLPRWLAVGAVAVVILMVTWSRAGYAGTPLYPDLQTQPPSDLRFDIVTIDGSARKVLRFSNTVANLGEGPLELQGKLQLGNGTVQVVQNIHDSTGTVAGTHPVGNLYYHAEHQHWHLDNFASYQLHAASGKTLGGNDVLRWPHSDRLVWLHPRLHGHNHHIDPSQRRAPS